MTKEELDLILRYDSSTGVFYWLIARGRVSVGSVAGSDDGRGYVVIRFKGKNYKAHLLAWLTCTGEWPPRQIDHFDTDRANNRFGNLRLSSQLENTYNQSLKINNKSGVKGVHWHAFSQRWRAVIGVNGKKVEIGQYSSIEHAKAAIESARKDFHKEFARH